MKNSQTLIRTGGKKPKNNFTQLSSLKINAKEELECNWQKKLLSLVEALRGNTKTKNWLNKGLQSHMFERDSFVFKRNKVKNKIKSKTQLFLTRLLALLALAYRPCFCLVTKVSSLTIDWAINKVELIEINNVVGVSRYSLWNLIINI